VRRPFLRSIAALAGVAAPLLLASPASADPEDGEGCAGLQSNPAAYVCVVALNPTAVPGVEQTGSATVFDDNVCYVAGCRRVTVTVPTVGVEMPAAPLLVVYYDGENHSVGLTSAPTPPPTGGYVATAAELAGLAARLAVGIGGGVVDELSGIDVVHWADCTVESETDDRVDLNSSSWYSGYTAMSCTERYLV
jgi:hypothetical protein